jgi:hypothetical protein
VQSERNDDQDRLRQTFNNLAAGSPTTDVAASDAARAAEFDPRSLDFDAALSYLVDVGLLCGYRRRQVQDHGCGYYGGATAPTPLVGAKAQLRRCLNSRALTRRRSRQLPPLAPPPHR